MSESALTPHTAPRDLDSLLRETPFKLRLLAQSLGGLTTEEQKMGWHQLQTNEARANHILSLLKQWDAANPGAARPAAGGAGSPLAPPPTTNGAHQPVAAPAPQAPSFAPSFQMPVTNIQPQAVAAPGAPPAVSQQAAAGAQAAAGSEKRTRAPRTSGGAEAGAELGGQVLGLLNTILGGLKADADQRQEFQRNLTALLETAASDKTSRVTALESKYGEMHETLKHLSAAMQSQSNLQLWTLMAFLTFMENSMGVGMVEILRAAINDSAMFQKLVDQAMGKA